MNINIFKKRVLVALIILLFALTSFVPNIVGDTTKKNYSVESNKLSLTSIIPSKNSKDFSFQKMNQVEIIVYTAVQEWPSKSWIYILNNEGVPIKFYSYDWYIFNDVEVVNNEVYVADWVAPRLYKVNISTGALTVIIDDWSLYYMYDVAYDGNYFYIKEWSLNRYNINGVKYGSTSFNYNVKGSGWDGTYYWTLLNTSEIKCWDISYWPTITEIPQNSFNAPTAACRGLWYDGTYFWTAESIEGSTGFIYQFDKNGNIISQIPEPIPKGYAACFITVPNEPPQKPDTPQGPNEGKQNINYQFSTSATDPENNEIYYQWDWGDGQTSSWEGPYQSGAIVTQTHSWEHSGSYAIQVRAKDIYNSESPWSEAHTILIENNPPAKPNITGFSQAKPGISYPYRFYTTDPDEDMVYYFIDWGDNTQSDWFGPFQSGMIIELFHQWNASGNYLIKAKAKDIYDQESDWGTLKVSVPKTRISLFNILLEKFFTFFHEIIATIGPALV